MVKNKRFVKTAAAALGVGCGLFLTAPAMAVTELCLAIDSSGSIVPADFTLQLEGYAQAVENPAVVPQNSQVAVAVVQFSTNAQLGVARTLIDNQTTASSVAATIRGLQQIGSLTAFAPPINACTDQFEFNTGDTQVIDISTDGTPTAETDDEGPAAADEAVTAGVDAVNALGVGGAFDVGYLNNLVRPQPVSAPPDPGFVVMATNFDEFASTVEAKIVAEVEPEPEPEPGPAPKPTPVPTLSEWGVVLLLLSLVAVAWRGIRRT
jgi:hypothetical protein